ncbi:MAG: acVLRF1 family peptidyl-tRNA hydrolase [Oryzihumus sp.]
MSSPAPVDARRIEVDPARIARWVAGFGERHGIPAWTVGEGALTLAAPDGARAVLQPWLPAGPCPAGDVGSLTAWAEPPRVVGLVLVRRGGYAVGLAEGERLVAHKAGTRYVQSRTAAGGWSQQRYARRRGNQADALATAVADHAQRLVLPGGPGALVVGGDRALVRDVLADPRLGPLAGLPRRELPDLPDPRLAVLEQALRRGRAVRVLVSDGA